ncbi:MAG: prepilin-type N-terminal cleavage/methylation domain-containing protein, partial [Planctomycetota bacterium]
MLILTSKIAASKRDARQGFSLMEVVIAVSIMSVIAGVSLPVTLTVLDRANVKATKQELQNLADASSRMFEDTKTLPLSVEDLLIDQGTPGW